ncbi:Ribonuclease BN, tRNA processing enzyme [Alkalithermobacter thermoalcaliphilus JW-YL-7 = DSM 7308]|uniref:Beta-lactamase domain protein n=1 Tax=Alkalithermobacter thermoalcaliphilus JW-YL-7 = DSM 7308 TaxID=1121328 RepID=A0A150FSU1_CLOPD|nr:beta-lactamase domain protein [[Clostridium] paradoxum JW-YL-7 = DSM 7308]SHL01648.1 Ribonuclease BN, tRNA processing enzyme [[Clostridium] paradoxum JW-YL-7 = DSM 7308]
MKLTVIGCFGPYPKAGGACSGYLIEWEKNKLLLDLGNGVLSRYLELGHKVEDLTGIIISHFHADHMSDLLILRYLLQVKMINNQIKKPIPIYCPSTPSKFYEEVKYKNVYSINTIRDKQNLTLNGLNIKFYKTNHPVECYLTSIHYKDKKFVYTGDTDYFSDIEKIVQKSDLLLCEGGMLQSQKTKNTPHLSAKEAAQIANTGKVRSLILTHIYPENNIEDILKEAKKYYSGQIQIASEKMVYDI